MDLVIPFREGSYWVERAFLAAPDDRAAEVEEAVIDVYLDPRGNRRMNGRGFVRNVLVVEILEDHDELDLLLDLGPQFRYLLRAPRFQAGKVFEPATRSLLRFAPTASPEPLSEREFAGLLERLRVG